MNSSVKYFIIWFIGLILLADFQLGEGNEIFMYFMVMLSGLTVFCVAGGIIENEIRKRPQ